MRRIVVVAAIFCAIIASLVLTIAAILDGVERDIRSPTRMSQRSMDIARWLRRPAHLEAAVDRCTARHFRLRGNAIWILQGSGRQGMLKLLEGIDKRMLRLMRSKTPSEQKELLWQLDTLFYAFSDVAGVSDDELVTFGPSSDMLREACLLFGTIRKRIGFQSGRERELVELLENDPDGFDKAFDL